MPRNERNQRERPSRLSDLEQLAALNQIAPPPDPMQMAQMMAALYGIQDKMQSAPGEMAQREAQTALAKAQAANIPQEYQMLQERNRIQQEQINQQTALGWSGQNLDWAKLKAEEDAARSRIVADKGMLDQKMALEWAGQGLDWSKQDAANRAIGADVLGTLHGAGITGPQVDYAYSQTMPGYVPPPPRVPPKVPTREELGLGGPVAVNASTPPANAAAAGAAMTAGLRKNMGRDFLNLPANLYNTVAPGTDFLLGLLGLESWAAPRMRGPGDIYYDYLSQGKSSPGMLY